MTEIGIGVMFAAWFVTAYLLLAKLRGPGRQRVALRRNGARAGFDAAQLAESGKKPQLFLTTDALSQHHARGAGQGADGRHSARR